MNKTTTQIIPPSLFILAFMASLGPFGDTLYTPSLPNIAKNLHVTYNMTQLTMTAYLFGFSISQLFYGPLSDRFGRRPIMLYASICFILGSLICYLSYFIGVLIVGRFVQAIGACAGGVLSSAAIRDAFSSKERGKVFAKVNIFFALAPGMGPIIGSFIDHYLDWHYDFLLLFILSCLLLLSVWWLFHETNLNLDLQALKPKKLLSNYLFLLKNATFVCYSVIAGLCVGVVYSCLIEAPALVINLLGLASTSVSIIALGVMFGFICGSVLCNLLSNRIANEWIIALGLLVMILGSAILKLFAVINFVSLFSMLVPIIVVFIGIALILPIATSQLLAPFQDMAGSASGLLGCIEMGLASLSTLLMSYTHNSTANAMPNTFLILDIIAVIVFVLYLCACNKHRQTTIQ